MHAWLLQRLTAVFMLACFIAVIFYFLLSPPQNYSEWRGMVTATPVALSSILFFMAISLHAWIGLRDIVIDYVHRFSLRVLLLGLIFIMLFGQTLWLFLVLLKAMYPESRLL
ncbi:MAG: succinate dehydrogenase, hydrophobic membrane anchor protein [Gammaproteobacteria bacterium]|nr:succinate dehydrogenase, hydrophobic membrane anchor protein [Gammaproteobacteria bacterium]